MTPRKTKRQPSYRASRWKKGDWIEFGAEMLRREGSAGITLERLCQASGRTKGSFYHHFESVNSFLKEIARHWKESETDAIVTDICQIKNPRKALAELARRSASLDVRLEIGIRALASSNSDVKRMMDEVDKRREQTIASLLADAYKLDPVRSLEVARLFHGLHLSALIRAPCDIGSFSLGPTRQLVRWLEQESTRSQNNISTAL